MFEMQSSTLDFKKYFILRINEVSFQTKLKDSKSVNRLLEF